MIKLSETFGDGGGPEAFENCVVLFGANTLIDNVGGSGIFGNAVTHEGAWYISKCAFFLTEFLPSVPVDITFEI